jgi:hypothetical protein
LAAAKLWSTPFAAGWARSESRSKPGRDVSSKYMINVP